MRIRRLAALGAAAALVLTAPVAAAAVPASPLAPASAIAAPAAPGAPAPRTVTILGSGDVLLHEQLWAQARQDAKKANAYNFNKIVSAIKPEIRAADLAICQLETPVSSPRGPFSGWPRFSVPPQVLTAIKRLGYDSCTTASNHTLDAGQQGVTRTLDALDKRGIAHTGSARSAKEAKNPPILTMDNGVKVGQLAYTYSFNGLTRPTTWMANLIDIGAIKASAKKLKKRGADIVVLSLHWGVEYSHTASATQRAQARSLLKSPDIDLILGAHAHVVQPAEKIKDKWVFYSMGNQLARHANPIDATREGIMPVVTFTERADGTFQAADARIVPTWMQLSPKLRLIDLKSALTFDTLTPQARATYRAALKRIRGYLGAYGAKLPVRVLP